MKWQLVKDVCRPHLAAVYAFMLLLVVVPVMLVEAAYAPLIIRAVFRGYPAMLLYFVLLAMQCLVWAIPVCLLCLAGIVTSVITQTLRRWVRVSSWTPVLLALTAAPAVFAGKGTPGIILGLMAGAAVSVYWGFFLFSESILRAGTRTRIGYTALWCLFLAVALAAAVYPTYARARQAADECMKKTVDGPWEKPAAALVLLPEDQLSDGWRWVFRYRHGETRKESRLVYVTIPGYEVYGICEYDLNPVTLWGVLP